MALPERIVVKLSTEAAEYVALTPVVAQEMTFLELLEPVAGACGGDAVRVAGILKRGSLVSGATRYRWAPFVCAPEELGPFLARLPHAEPERRFDPARCVRAVLVGETRRVEVAREVASRRRLFRRRSFWDTLMEVAGTPCYVDYLHRERADRYRIPLDLAAQAKVHEGATLIGYKALERQVETAAYQSLELIAER